MGYSLSNNASTVCEFCTRLFENAQDLVEKGLVEHTAGISAGVLLETTLSSFGAGSNGAAASLGYGVVKTLTRTVVNHIKSLDYIPSPVRGCKEIGLCSEKELDRTPSAT